MAKKAEDLYREALALSDDEREQLVRLLITRPESGFASAQIERAWMEEIDRRERLHADGKMGSVSWDELKRDLRERHGL